MLLAAGMAVSVTACASPNEAAKEAAGLTADTKETPNDTTASQTGSGSQTGSASQAQPASGAEEVNPEDGYAFGYVGDLFHTYFFDLRVDDAWLLGDTYGGYTAEEGYQLIEVDITVINTFGDTIPMYDADFQLDWGDSDDGYTYPLTAYDKGAGEDMLPSEYELAKDESRSGVLIYEVPDDVNDSIDIELAYQEVLVDSSGNSKEGDLILVILNSGSYGTANEEDALAEAEDKLANARG